MAIALFVADITAAADAPARQVFLIEYVDGYDGKVYTWHMRTLRRARMFWDQVYAAGEHCLLSDRP